MVAGKFCSECGYESDSQRGACLMCYALLDQAGEATQCPQCGAGNPASASFCQQCGTGLVAGVGPVASIAAGAALIVEAAGESLVTAGPEPVLAEVSAADLVAEEAETLAVEPQPAALEEMEVGELIEPVQVEEEYAPPPPTAIAPEELVGPEEELEEEFAPPPPPGAVELEEEEFAPPPPPGAVELEEEEPALPGALEPEAVQPEVAEEEFGPPPPPPGTVSLDEEEEAEEPEELGAWGLESEE